MGRPTASAGAAPVKKNRTLYEVSINDAEKII